MRFNVTSVAVATCGVFNSDVANVGKDIRARRDQKGWTQHELSSFAKVSFSLIQKSEASAGRFASRPKFRMIAEALGVAPEILDPEWQNGESTASTDRVARVLKDLGELVASGALTTGAVIETAKKAAASASPAARAAMDRKKDHRKE